MWKQQATKLFSEGNKINDIANAVGVSRRTLSDYFKTLPEEIHRRRDETKKQMRREYQNNWDRTKRQDWTVGREEIRRQHEVDVKILSAERYF